MVERELVVRSMLVETPAVEAGPVGVVAAVVVLLLAVLLGLGVELDVGVALPDRSTGQ